jgi:hypothetical protein
LFQNKSEITIFECKWANKFQLNFFYRLLSIKLPGTRISLYSCQTGDHNFNCKSFTASPANSSSAQSAFQQLVVIQQQRFILPHWWARSCRTLFRRAVINFNRRWADVANQQSCSKASFSPDTAINLTARSLDRSHPPCLSCLPTIRDVKSTLALHIIVVCLCYFPALCAWKQC